jgi:DNA-binding beta-propeller fold protein YncE
MLRFFFSTLTLLSFSLVINAQERAQSPESAFHVIKKMPLGGDGGWDYLTVHPEVRRLYIARSNRVMVVDLEQGALLGEIKNTPGVHGVALVPQRERGFISCGGDASVAVFDLKSLKETNRIKVSQRPDAIIYDPHSSRVFTGNAIGELTAIDAETEKVAGTVKLGGKPEALVSDEKGHLYVNIEDKNEIQVIDAKNLTVMHHWPIAPGTEPTGLSIDKTKRRLFCTCHNDKMVVLDADSGHVIETVKIGKGTDACVFDPDTNLAFSSNGDGTLTVVGEKEGKYEVMQNVATQAGARTMALDSKTHHIYLVTAKAKAGQRRSYEPDSFEVLEVGR